MTVHSGRPLKAEKADGEDVQKRGVYSPKVVSSATLCAPWMGAEV